MIAFVCLINVWWGRAPPYMNESRRGRRSYNRPNSSPVGRNERRELRRMPQAIRTHHPTTPPPCRSATPAAMPVPYM